MNISEFYHLEQIVLFERESVKFEQTAYLETAAQDEEICMRMTEGHCALFKQSINETGPYQMPMEAGLAHFHQFLKCEIEPYLSN